MIITSLIPSPSKSQSTRISLMFTLPSISQIISIIISTVISTVISTNIFPGWKHGCSGCYKEIWLVVSINLLRIYPTKDIPLLVTIDVESSGEVIIQIKINRNTIDFINDSLMIQWKININ